MKNQVKKQLNATLKEAYGKTLDEHKDDNGGEATSAAKPEAESEANAAEGVVDLLLEDELESEECDDALRSVSLFKVLPPASPSPSASPSPRLPAPTPLRLPSRPPHLPLRVPSVR